MKNTIGVVMALGFIILAILVAVTGCGVSKTVNGHSELKPVEIKEYQGEKLSSVNDFSENSIKGPQYVDKEKYRLAVAGLVVNPKEYTYEQAITSYKSYQKVITLNCVEGWSVKLLWEGILLKDLLAEAGPSPNAKVVIFHAYDGYTTSLPLDYVVGNNLLLAYKMNDIAIPSERGFPFQLAAESKWGYKWIKWVTKIELSDDINYKGFWEKNGYSNDGSLDKGFFDN
jgi:DMSO/TMAO reductase YedYZ molybdopterin-dependent catalytic subunit